MERAITHKNQETGKNGETGEGRNGVPDHNRAFGHPPWNLTADRRVELTSPEASVPINDSSQCQLLPAPHPSPSPTSDHSVLAPTQQTGWAIAYRKADPFDKSYGWWESFL